MESHERHSSPLKIVLPDVLWRSGTPVRESWPEDLVARAARRLGDFAGLVALVGLLEAAWSHSVEYVENATYPRREDVLDLVGVGVAVVLSSLMFAAVRSRVWSSRVLVQIGRVYLVLLAFVISCTDHSDYFWRDHGSLHAVPSIGLLILTFPILIPSTRGQAVWLGLLMAAMGPLSLWALAAALDYQWPHVGALIETFPWIAAVLGAVIAGIVHDLGSEVRRARTLGAYVLEDSLGVGGMGEVFRARHRLLQRPAAIKLIRAAHAPNPLAHERFKREARVTAALRSPHTIELYDFGFSQSGHVYYVMELLEGWDLERFIRRFGAQPAARVVFWIKQVCHSLREAHAVGLVHRDIKPSNLVVCRYGADYDFIKLLDFGLVSLAPSVQVDAAHITGSRELAGTPAFMAPEVVMQSAPIDARTDLYALGCVMFWLLTGRFVFDGPTPTAVIVAHVHTEPEPPSRHAPHPVPEGLDRIVLGCLAKEQGARPASAEELAAALGELELDGWDGVAAEAWWREHTNELSLRPPPEVSGAEDTELAT